MLIVFTNSGEVKMTGKVSTGKKDRIVVIYIVFDDFVYAKIWNITLNRDGLKTVVGHPHHLLVILLYEIR